MLELPSHLHPMVVHFPIALFISALGLEVLSFILKKEGFHQTALHIYVIAALITPLVVRTGIWEAQEIHLSHPLLNQHRQLAFWTMWISLMSLPVLWYSKRVGVRYFRIIFFIILLSVAGLVSLTADKGGHMVFEYGVGVEG